MEMPAPLSIANAPTQRTEMSWREWGGGSALRRSAEASAEMRDNAPLGFRARGTRTEGATWIAFASLSVPSSSDPLRTGVGRESAAGSYVSAPPIIRRNSNRADVETAQSDRPTSESHCCLFARAVAMMGTVSLNGD